MSVLRVHLVTGLLAASVLACACQGGGPSERSGSTSAGRQPRASAPPTRSIPGATLDVGQDRALPSGAVIGVGAAANAQGGPGVDIHLVVVRDRLARITAARGAGSPGPTTVNGAR